MMIDVAFAKQFRDPNSYKTNFYSKDQFSTLPVMPGCLKLPSKFMLKILNITASITQ